MATKRRSHHKNVTHYLRIQQFFTNTKSLAKAKFTKPILHTSTRTWIGNLIIEWQRANLKFMLVKSQCCLLSRTERTSRNSRAAAEEEEEAIGCSETILEIGASSNYYRSLNPHIYFPPTPHLIPEKGMSSEKRTGNDDEGASLSALRVSLLPFLPSPDLVEPSFATEKLLFHLISAKIWWLWTSAIWRPKDTCWEVEWEGLICGIRRFFRAI